LILTFLKPKYYNLFSSLLTPFLGLGPPDRWPNKLQPGLPERRQPELRGDRENADPRSDARSGALFRPLLQFHRRKWAQIPQRQSDG
jgi:hypothetical protein